MKKYISILAVMISFMVAGSPSSADTEHEMPVYKGSPAFQKMKELAGKWEGTVDMGKGPQKIDASYRITSAGSALVETIFEGTPNEMITIYHDDKNNRLGLTHYCGLNNQPKMVLMQSKGDALEFDLAQDAPIDKDREPHMHALTLTFSGANAMEQHWTQFAQGEKKKVVMIAFRRIP